MVEAEEKEEEFQVILLQEVEEQGGIRLRMEEILVLLNLQQVLTEVLLPVNRVEEERGLALILTEVFVLS
jgi:hypothetical protein